MPITVTWNPDAEAVVVKTYRGRWNWDDVRSSVQEVEAMLPAGLTRYDVILDVAGTLFLPPNMITMVKRMLDREDARLGITVVVGSDFNRDMMAAIASQYPSFAQRYFFAYSITEALSVIALAREGRPIPERNRALHNTN